MINDGVADRGDNRWLQDLLAGWQGSDPNVLASLVLRETYQQRHGGNDWNALCVYLSAGKKGRREVQLKVLLAFSRATAAPREQSSLAVLHRGRNISEGRARKI